MKWICKNQKTIRIVSIVIYIFIILWITILSRDVGTQRIFKGLFWEIRVHAWKDTIKNILLFVPLGFLIGGKRGVIFGLCLTIFIECTQYIFVLGYCELDDILNNFTGTVIGVLIRKFLIELLMRNNQCLKR